MTMIDEIDLSDFASIHTIANTPVFLYKHFSRVPRSEAIARAHSAGDLAAAFNHYANKIPRDGDDVLRAYIALVALGLSGSDGFHDAVASLRPDRLPWGREVMDVMLTRRRPGTGGRVSVPTAPASLVTHRPATAVSPNGAITVNLVPPSGVVTPSLLIVGGCR